MRRFPKRRSSKLSVEQLEDRNLMSIFGVPWPTDNLTLSFEPDGTSINGTGSNLFSSLNASMPTATWQNQILQAFQTWAVETNLNIGLVSDSGAANGLPGGPTGSSQFGDIRISGLTQPQATGLIETSPFSVLNGSWAGDSIVNTSDSFDVGGGSASYDLFTAYLHDAGIALGMANSPDISSAMYENYLGPRTGLNSADIAGIQALYGAPQADPGNNSLNQATPLNVGSGAQVNGDISSLQDTDFYQLTGLQPGSTVAIRLQTQGLSLFDGRITLYQNNRAIATMTPSSIDQNIKLIIPNVHGRATYSIEVQSGIQNVFGMGGYQLVVAPTTVFDPTGDRSIPNVGTPNNHSFNTATSLTPQPVATSSGFSYSETASLSTPSEFDYYKLQGSQASLNRGHVMTVMVWSQGATEVDPTVTVYDQNRNPVPSTILVDQAGDYVIQLNNATSPFYYVEVQAANPGGSHAVGSYFMGVEFNDNIVSATAQPAQALTTASNTTVTGLTVGDTRLIYFAVAVQGSNAADAVCMTIFDQNEKELASVTASTAGTATISLLLTPGTYYIGFGAGQTSGKALSSTGVSFTLSTLVVSDPIDPDPSDPTSGGGDGGTGGGTTVGPSGLNPAPIPPLPAPPD